MTIDLIQTVTDTTRQLLGEGEMYLVDVEVKGTPAAPIIWVFVDTVAGGVGIDACAKLSRELNFHMGTMEGIPDQFTLNVSSPGLDRPLKDLRQFQANLGRTASAKYRGPDGKTQTTKGKLVSVDDTGFTLADDKGAEHRFSLSETELKIIPVFS